MKKQAKIDKLPTSPKHGYRRVTEGYNKSDNFVFESDLRHWTTGKMRRHKEDVDNLDKNVDNFLM